MSVLKKGKKFCKGFSLVELMVVIVIMGVLAAVAVPNLFGSIEKARRAEDITAAKTIEHLFEAMVTTGDIELDETQSAGIFLVVCKDKNSCPGGYPNADTRIGDANSSMYLGADGGVKVYGKKVPSWKDAVEGFNKEIEKMFPKGYHSQSKGFNSNNGTGWDWYVVEYFRNKDGVKLPRIYSGQAKQESGIKLVNNITNIEKAMNVKFNANLYK